MLPFEISPEEVDARRKAGEAIRLLDCREPFEWEMARVEGAELIPMNMVPEQLNAIEAMADDALVVVYCHHGVRSLNVAHWLRQRGVERVQSMAGGIEAWSVRVDRAVPRY
jgi:rhodanese-related sulfurtransferase